MVAAVAERPGVRVDPWDAGEDGAGHAPGATEPMDTDRAKSAQPAFHPDGRLPAGAGEDGTVRPWSTADPERPHPAHSFSGHGEGVDEVVPVGPHGRTVITTSAGPAHVVDLGACPEAAADTLGMACRAAGGGPTREEWEEQAPETGLVEACPARE
ncbi:hypothetical protein B7767_13565 [Streptomyces sp. 13-12-16]|nr:hypothetical protein B7767_13565 [Streptomyces sp. 13-12-16]